VHALLTLAAALLMPALLAPPPALADGPRALTVEQWRRDLRVLADTLVAVHRDAFHRLSRAAFERQVAALDRRIARLSDHEVIVGLAEIAAAIGDGHTRLTLPEDPAVAFSRAHTPTPLPKRRELLFHHLPLRLYLYGDGLFVQQATAVAREALGARVVRIGTMSAEEALEAMRPLIERDNEMGFKLLAPARLAIPEVLHARGVVADPRSVRVVLRGRDGREFALDLAPLESFAPATWIDARDSAAAVPLWLRDPGRTFWVEYLPRDRAVYAQVNRIADDSLETLAQFSRRLARVVDGHAVERVILDLRLNAGGDNALGRGLVLALARSRKADRPGRLYAIVGRGTFSAAMTLASQLEQWTHTVFVGEPTGSSPSAFGDPRKVRLPHSGLTVRISTVYWRGWTTAEDRPWIAPQLPAEPSSEDYRLGRDPALEAALAFPARDGLAGVLRETLRRGDIESAAIALDCFHNDPASADESTEQLVNRLARELLQQDRAAEAATVFWLNAHDYPRSAAAHAGRGEALERAGETRQALESYHRALALDPGNADLARKVEALERRGEGLRE